MKKLALIKRSQLYCNCTVHKEHTSLHQSFTWVDLHVRSALMILELAIRGPPIHHSGKASGFIIIQRTDML